MKHDKPAIGLWFAPCCGLDVQQIKDVDDLECVLETIDEEDMGNWFSYSFYDSEEEIRAVINESESSAV